jgi:hypothetical protein
LERREENEKKMKLLFFKLELRSDSIRAHLREIVRFGVNQENKTIIAGGNNK